jgi:ribonuclease HI
VKNKEIWVALDVAASDHEQVRWHWVKGHIGHTLNERADVLAVAATQTAARSGRRSPAGDQPTGWSGSR